MDGNKALQELRASHLRLTSITFRYQLRHAEKMLLDYFKANQELLLKEFPVLEKNIGGDLKYLKEWITSFV